MKRIIYLVMAFTMSSIATQAQQKKTLTLENLMGAGARGAAPSVQIKNAQWWNDACIELTDKDIKTIAIAGGKEEIVVTNEVLNKALKEAGLKEQKRFMASMPYAEKQVLIRIGRNEQALIDVETEKVVWKQAVPANAANTDWNKISRHIAYTIDNNLFVCTADGKLLQVTNEPKGILCGQSVHRNEFGIVKGTFWSPKGNLLAFYRMDESMVTDYPQVNTSTRIATLEPDKYPMAGMTSHKVTVGIYNPLTTKTVYLQAGDPTDRYFTNISWSPDEQKVYMIELNRDQNEAKLVRYSAETGEQEAILLTETHEKYVEPQEPITFLPWDSKLFIYQSQRDGYNHLYLYNTDGKLIKQVTKGDWVVQKLCGMISKTKEIVYTSTQESPLQTHAYAISLTTGKSRILTPEAGMHNIALSASGKYCIDSYSSSTVSRSSSIIPVTAKGKTVSLGMIPDNMAEQYNMPEITVGTIKAADGKTDLYYRLIKPVDFDPNKKYPAIIYVYGGPHAQMIHNTRCWGAGTWDLCMAQLGYVMLTVDNRGSENRGLEFENCTFRQLGVEEMKDQVKGVDLLKSLGYVDMGRIGVHGWSFGGFMTTNLMLTYNDIFKVGVAGGPVIDWALYEVMYGERYMDTPQANPEGYKNSNLKLKANRLKGRLQVIIGGEDPTCVPQHSISFLRACIDAGTHPDFFIYPEDGHNMGGYDRLHLLQHITRYFEDYLK